MSHDESGGIARDVRDGRVHDHADRAVRVEHQDSLVHGVVLYPEGEVERVRVADLAETRPIFRDVMLGHPLYTDRVLFPVIENSNLARIIRTFFSR